MTLKSHLICDFHVKTSRFRHQKTRHLYGRQRITLPGNLHIWSTSGLSFLMHDIFTLSNATSYDKTKTGIMWAAPWQNQQNGMCAQQRLISAWASTQSDQSLRCTQINLGVRFLHAESRLWSDWADAQADLMLRWAHSHIVGFVMRRLKSWPPRTIYFGVTCPSVLKKFLRAQLVLI